mgnify:CR=1 FL=1
MIDYSSIKPMMSLSTFIAGFLILLLIARAIVELAEYKKARQERGNVQASQRRHLSPSQKAIQRYYSRKGA